jgi:DNA (cytosine-5)-methyltransferase 1
MFTGAGGLALGLSSLNVEHSGLIEINKNACSTLRSNFAKNTVHEIDIREFDFNSVNNIDLIAGGPPCQPFSLGGKHKGKLDERDMFPYAIKSIEKLKPKAFIFENVKGLLRESFSTYYNYTLLQLTYPLIRINKNENWLDHLKRLEDVHTKNEYNELKYNIVYRLVNAADYGIPQTRERVFIVGIRNDLHINWSFPNPTHSLEALFYSKYISREYWKEFNINNPSIINSDLPSIDIIEKFEAKYSLFKPDLLAWKTVRSAIYDLQNLNSTSLEHQIRLGARSYPGHTGSHIDLPAKTLKAGDHGVPGGENMIRDTNGDIRYFTIAEAKRIQSFPDDYQIHGSWTEAMRQLGNAVPSKLPSILFKDLIEKLK